MTECDHPTIQYKITDDQSGTLYSERYDEFYHCRGGALLKAQQIFLAPLLEQDEVIPPKQKHILEVGFGAGLNFFVTADHYATLGIPLQYTALEHDLLSRDAIEPLRYEQHLTQPQIIRDFFDWCDTLPKHPEPGLYVFSANPHINLHMQIGNALETSLDTLHYDWVYLDAFSPAKNPELWTEVFLQTLYDVLKPGGGLSTYCVKGDVRRAMKRVGFDPQKRKGIPGKREVLVAYK